MCFGQIEQFLNAGSKAHAEELATPECDQRVRQLITTAQRIGPWIHKTEDPVTAVGRHDDQDGEGNQQQENQDHKGFNLHAAEEQDAEGDRDDHHKGTEVRFFEQQRSHQHHRHKHRQKGFLEAVHHIHLAHREIGRVEHHKQFHELGGLQIHDKQR